VTPPGPVARAVDFASLAHVGPLTGDEIDRAVDACTRDEDPRVRAAALGALVRGASNSQAHAAWDSAILDRAPAVRRRAAELAPNVGAEPERVAALIRTLDDDDVTVVEAAAWALGELGDSVAEHPGAVAKIANVATDHTDPLAREAAVAALGALGNRDGLAAILQATRDKPAVRRRAVLALAPFDGPDVDAALAVALDDKDWQVRQAAEDLGD